MPTIKNEIHSRIVKIDLDTAEYVIEKVIDAVFETLNGNKLKFNLPIDEMLDAFGNQLINILNEIKEKNDAK